MLIVTETKPKVKADLKFLKVNGKNSSVGAEKSRDVIETLVKVKWRRKRKE